MADSGRWISPDIGDKVSGMRLLVNHILLFVILLMALPVSAGSDLQVFDQQAYQSILNNQKQQSFLLVLWSLDCPPCMEELTMLSDFHKQYPDKKIILVSTDSQSQSDEITGLINKFGLTQIPQWVFGNESSQYLRYSIDPMWYGELPRSYFHSVDARKAVSGKLNKADIIRWFNAG